MNIESMRTRPYRSFKVDGAELPAPARERLLAIRRQPPHHVPVEPSPAAACPAPRRAAAATTRWR